MKNHNLLWEGRYEPQGEIAYSYAKNKIVNNQRHIVYTGWIKTTDKYRDDKQTGMIAHSLEAWLELDVDPLEYIYNNRWQQRIEAEIQSQLDQPKFGEYNFSFLNSVHNSSRKTRA